MTSRLWLGLSIPTVMGQTLGAGGAMDHAIRSAAPSRRIGVMFKQDQSYDEARSFERALRIRPGSPRMGYQLATLDLITGNIGQACSMLERLIHESPDFVEAHVSPPTEGDRERETVLKLTAGKQASEPEATVQ